MDTIGISKFRATCLERLDWVKRTGQPLLITRRGEAIAEVIAHSLPKAPSGWLGSLVRRALNELPVREAPMTHEVTIRSEALRLGHKDPADRFIVATAHVYDLTLVTSDKRLVTSRQVPVLSNVGS